MSRFTRFGIKPGLERINALLEIMGRPDTGLPCVHVGGTNGKGSTSLIVAQILNAAGYRTGHFVSPHLHSYLERLMIDGKQINGDDFISYLHIIEQAANEMVCHGLEHPTEFEALTAMACKYFYDQQVDIAVLEVGMGGLYDSTNIVSPLVSVITGIDLDHVSVLGDTLPEIAANKAGIIKPLTPVVVGNIAPVAREVIINRANHLQASCYDNTVVEVKLAGQPGLDGQEVSISMPGHDLSAVRFSLPGCYQLENLRTALSAIAVLEAQNFSISNSNIELALASLKNPGRLETLCSQPLVLIDVAHNPSAARALAHSLDCILPKRDKVLVCGMVDDKDAENTLKYLGKNTSACIITRPDGNRSSNWNRLTQQFARLYPHIPVIEVEDIIQAIEQGMARLINDQYLLITGSFYVLDRARSWFTGY
ncbi:MAG: bifunctional folylpolyglutamate synthase/dihydrofolate synthase [Syntrophomonadaceae bacterium]|nr:bifunctional folylpolyglutamate synthase/dihydrofolate synthase [Syntrophomonadaceae bacterium]